MYYIWISAAKHVFNQMLLTFGILSGCCFIRFDVDTVLVGVDECTGLIYLDGPGLVNEVSDRTLLV